MIYFGWSDFDPVGGSATSIDPLRSLAHSVRLGDLIFPGSSGRIWRARYISALCFLLKHARLEKGQDYRANYIKYRRYENAFILCLNQLKKKYSEEYDFNRIIGMDKAEQLVRVNPGSVQIDNDILANQMNLGPLGVHSVLLKDLELIDDERELILLPKGEKLADLYEASLGTSAQGFLDPLKSQKAKRISLDNFEGLNEKMLFELKSSNQKSEQKAILDLLNQHDTRKQCISDVLGVGKSDETSEAEFISMLAKFDSPLNVKYQLIEAYDNFQRVLHYFFNGLRQVTKSDFRFNLKSSKRVKTLYGDLESEIKSKAEALLKSVESYLDNHDDNDGTCAEIRDHATNVKLSANDHAEFTTFLIHHHLSHQKVKGKAPWVSFASLDVVEIHPSNIFDDSMPSYKEYSEFNMHSYRLSNCFKMMSDLGAAG